MITNKLHPFIVEDGLNTSYIDSLFVSMFFKPSYIQNILSDYVDNLNFLHLQDIIYHYFVHNMRCGYTINAQIMNEIRNYLIYCGWKNDCNIVDLFEVQELFDFIMNGCSNEKITFNNTDSIDTNTITNTNTITSNYIHLNIQKNSDVKTLIDDLIINKLGNYKLLNLPNFIPVFLDRNLFSGKINDSLIDIQEAIQFEKNNTDPEQNEVMWILHSIICYTKADRGNYYSIVFDENGWYLYSNSKLPSLIKINIKDEDISYKIKRECVFLLYTLDKR
jgi:hypothetical protein